MMTKDETGPPTFDLLALNRVLAPLNDVVFILDREQRHVAVFGRWPQEHGIAPDMLLGKTAIEVMGPVNGRIHEEANAKALSGESVVYEWQTPVGAQIQTMQTSLSPLRDEAGVIAGVVGVGRDITSLKRTQDELQAALAAREAELARRDAAFVNAFDITPGLLTQQFESLTSGASTHPPLKVDGLRVGLQRIAEVLRELGVVTSPARVLPERLENEIPKLSPREQQVLNLLFGNLRVGSIAVRLKISPNTVRNHLKAVFRKLGVHSQRELLELLHQA
jgi:PAS domain S-box-containing protein